jgi:hypothetical protein
MVGVFGVFSWVRIDITDRSPSVTVRGPLIAVVRKRLHHFFVLVPLNLSSVGGRSSNLTMNSLGIVADQIQRSC